MFLAEARSGHLFTRKRLPNPRTPWTETGLDLRHECDTWLSSPWRAPEEMIMVLTIGHLDHDPENCDPENLRC